MEEDLKERFARVDDDIARESRPTIRSLAEQADRTDESSASSSTSLFSGQLGSE